MAHLFQLRVALLMCNVSTAALLTSSNLEKCFLEISLKYFDTKTIQIFTSYNRQNTTQSLKAVEDEKSVSLLFTHSLQWTVLWYNQHYRQMDTFYMRYRNDIGKINVCVVDMSNLEMDDIELLLEKVINNPLWNSRAKVLIVLSAEQDFLKLFILNEVWCKKRGENVTIMLVESDYRIGFYSWYPYKRNQCREVKEIEALDMYVNGSFMYNVNLFPYKLKDHLNSCELRAITAYFPPFTFGNNAQIDGIETKILRTLVKYFNLKLVFVDLPKNQSIYVSKGRNGTIVGSLGMLVRQEADVTYAAFMNTKERFHIAKPLRSHSEDSFVWIFPTPDPPPRWINIYMAFSPLLWGLILANFFISSGIVCLIANFEPNAQFSSFRSLSTSFFNIWQQWLSGYVSSTPKSVLLNAFLFIMAVYSLHINSAYQSSLITRLTTPLKGKPFQNVKEIIDAGLVCYLNPGLESTYNQSDHDLWNRILQPNKYIISDKTFDIIENIAINKTSFFLNSLVFLRYQIKNKYTDQFGNPKILHFSKAYMRNHAVIYVSPGNPLRGLLNRKIKQLIESGLVQFWSANFQQKGASLNGNQLVVLSFHHLEGVFMIPAIGLALSLFIFLSEITLVCVCKK